MINPQPQKVNRSSILILLQFFYVFEKRPLFDAERSVGAEFPATETADAEVVVEHELFVFYLNGFGWAGVHAYPAQPALFRYGTGAGGDIVAQPVLEKCGQTELYIKDAGKTEIHYPRFVRWCADSFDHSAVRSIQVELCRHPLKIKKFFRNTCAFSG